MVCVTAHWCFIIMADILQGLRAWWPHDGFRRWGSANKQVFVYQSWPSVSKVHLSSWTRWQKPARIKEVGLWPTLTFSALSTRNESAPSSNVVRDISRAHEAGGKRGMVCRAPWPVFFRMALASPHASTAHEQRKQCGGCSWSRSLQQPTLHILSPCTLWSFCEINNTLKFHFFKSQITVKFHCVQQY